MRTHRQALHDDVREARDALAQGRELALPPLELAELEDDYDDAVQAERAYLLGFDYDSGHAALQTGPA